MDLPALIDALSRPDAYPFPAEGIEVHQTHISVVFLAGGFAYKIKKPVNLGFLDFSTLERRKHFCEEEVRLNRRLAPSVYLGVVPVTEAGGRVVFEGTGDVVEWAVKMVRLPAEATLEQRLLSGEVTEARLEELSRVLAEFHRAAATSPEIARFGDFATVSRNALENFSQARPEIGVTVHADVLARLEALTTAALERLRPLIESRAARGVPRDTHGDLHLDHVYLFDSEPRTVVVDCIEFNDRFRYADPVADMAFLVMDLKFHGRPDPARGFADAYFCESGDEEGRALLPFYASYRAAVRAKVEGFELRECEIDTEERGRALAKAKAHWLLALGELEEPAHRPCLLLVGGLPGSGKSTLARGLAAGGAFEVIRSDVVRKEIAPQGGDLYAPEMTDRTYRECLRRAIDLLFAGRCVIVDATFREERWRGEFLRAARGLAVPALILICRSDPATTRTRLAHRRGDASDADWSVYQRLVGLWEPATSATAALLREIDTTTSVEETVTRAVEALHETGLA
jgi:aminoglycoside phosphotransferase family enzyme/predicted kinase